MRVQQPPDACPLGSTFAFLSRALRTADAATMRRRLGPRCEQRVASVACGIPVDELELTPAVAGATLLFDGESSPLEVATFSTIDPATVFRTALVLLEVDLLQTR